IIFDAMYLPVSVLALLCCIAPWVNSLAQSKTLLVTDGNKPLPYATVINLRTGFGQFASEKGTVELIPALFSAGDTLRISYTGYADTLVKLPTSGYSIGLRPISIPLQNVEVYPCKDSKLVSLKNYRKHKKNYTFGLGSITFFSYAAYLPNPDGLRGNIEAITIEQSYTTVPPNARKAPFKIRLLQYDSATGLPGNPLIAKEWLINPTGKTTTIDISDVSLRIPAHGLVVSIDLFHAGEQYSYKEKLEIQYKDGTKKTEWQSRYGASFRAVTGDNLMGIGYMNGKSGQWIKMSTFGNKPSAIMVKLSIQQCQ
ncbi:MAG: carboxypeptidase-like regulatory domain-containing protein, partial [Chitinophagaceae bacterium]|nr:carboxypeptidase-like regulatory domain-containing protein [Chitinophagaceae bacterium]